MSEYGKFAGHPPISGLALPCSHETYNPRMLFIMRMCIVPCACGAKIPFHLRDRMPPTKHTWRGQETCARTPHKTVPIFVAMIGIFGPCYLPRPRGDIEGLPWSMPCALEGQHQTMV